MPGFTHARRLRLAFATTMMLWLCTAALAAPATTPTMDALMHESFQQFDQGRDTGWRALQGRRDYTGAEKAMLLYQERHGHQLKAWQKDSLAFHLAHVYALDGKNAEAIHWFRKSMADHKMGNTDYANAFIAFLTNDKPALLAARKKIAAYPASEWRSEDLSEVDAMVRYFGAPFEAAWGALQCHGPAARAKTEVWRKFCAVVDAKYRTLYQEHDAVITARAQHGAGH